EPRVTVIEEQRTIQPTLDVVADCDHSEQLPLTEGGRLDAGARELTAPAVVGLEPEVALQRVGSHYVVCVVTEPEHDAARGIFRSGQRIELHRDIEIGEGALWRYDHVELVGRRTLDGAFVPTGTPGISSTSQRPLMAVHPSRPFVSRSG